MNKDIQTINRDKAIVAVEARIEHCSNCNYSNPESMTALKNVLNILKTNKDQEIHGEFLSRAFRPIELNQLIKSLLGENSIAMTAYLVAVNS